MIKNRKKILKYKVLPRRPFVKTLVLYSMASMLLYLFILMPVQGFSKSSPIKDLLINSNTQSLDLHLKQTASLKKERLKCQLQLKKNQVPASCYTWLKESKAYTNIKPFLRYLDEKCSENTPQIKKIHIARTFLLTPRLSAFCKKILADHIQILEYQLRDQKPQRFLEKVFRKVH